MIRLYSPKRAEKVIRRYAETIDGLERRYALPGNSLRAILHLEMTRMDSLDLLADGAVSWYWLKYRAGKILSKKDAFPGGLIKKRDSSTGRAQIFGAVGIRAVEFAVEKGLDTRAGLGLPPEPLSPDRPGDLCLVWRRLRRDADFNLRLAALNLLSCAQEAAGSMDFARFDAEAWQKTFSRYNANTLKITAYGREAYALFLSYGESPLSHEKA